jgi:hypothetical protein
LFVLLFFDLEEKYFLLFFASSKTRCIFDELKITTNKMENITTTPEEVITAKKMKMIYGYVFSNTLNQKQLNTLLKTPLVKLEVKLEKMEMKYLMDTLRGKIQID